MKNNYTLVRLSSLLFLFLTMLLIGCSHPHKLDKRERALGTGSERYAIFHRIVEADRGLGLRYPGFLIGLEKAYREDIGIGLEDWKHNVFCKHNDIDGLESAEFNSPKNKKRVKKILDDCKRTFVSHVIEYSVKSKLKNKNNEFIQTIPYVKEDIFYNVYSTDFKCFKDKYKCGNECTCSGEYECCDKHRCGDECTCSDKDKCSDEYECSNKAFEELTLRINKEVKEKFEKEKPYTHIFLYCMGWNTDQQESLRNYNSLLGLMIENYTGEGDFRPLFVGISWPSLWKWKFFKNVGILASYFTKADDADEVGLIWGNRILRDILVPIKKKRNIPLVLIGHSLGARLLTRALISPPLGSCKSREKHAVNDVDLVIGLEGAFSANRFIKGKGLEGYPYEKFKEYAKKFVFTWSKHDKANPVAGIYGAKYIGGEVGYKHTKKFEFFDHYNIMAKKSGNTTEDEDGFNLNDEFENYVLDKNYNRIFCKMLDEEQKLLNDEQKVLCVGQDEQDSKKWKESFKDSSKISIVDASELICFQPYLKGGVAHNDIYTPGIAKFIWNCIETLAKVERLGSRSKQ